MIIALSVLNFPFLVSISDAMADLPPASELHNNMGSIFKKVRM